MPQIRSVCVYCGSAGAVDPRYRAAADELGRSVAAAGIKLVFGGGRIGLMGIAADAALAAGGHVTGVIPASLRDAELAHSGLSELVVVATMHDRKRVMAERADAFAVLPGGIGTLDETFEILTWRQLGLHDKPIFLVDIGGDGRARTSGARTKKPLGFAVNGRSRIATHCRFCGISNGADAIHERCG